MRQRDAEARRAARRRRNGPTPNPLILRGPYAPIPQRIHLRKRRPVMAGGYNDDRNRDRWRDDDRERSSWRSGSQGTSEREDERGFFERAGDEVRSWFSDDDNDRRDRDFGRSSMQRSSWDREQNRSFSSEPSRGREFGREDRSSFGGMAQGGYGRSSGQFGRDRDWSDQSKRNSRRPRRSRLHQPAPLRPQTWGATDHGQSSWDQGMSHLGYGDFGGTLGGFGNQRFGSSQDDHYRSWRDRQMAAARPGL